MSISDELVKLQALLSSGAITEEEFGRQKTSILAGNISGASVGLDVHPWKSSLPNGLIVLVSLTAIPIVLIALGIVLRLLAAQPLTRFDVLDVLSVIGPNGPDMVLTGILFLMSGTFGLTRLAMGAALLAFLYFLVEKERKLISNPIAAALLSAVIYCAVNYLLSLFLGRIPQFAGTTAASTFVFLLIIRAVMGAVIHVKSRGKS